MNKTGFGFLRLPRTEDGGINYATLFPVVDRFFELGGSYIDTAYTYLNGQSEEAVRKSIVERYPRDRFILADKLPGYQVKRYEDCEELFQEQLKRCGVDYFDVYMLHWLNAENYAIAEKHDEFRFLRELKAQGRAKQIGFSFHDSAALLDRILTAHPEIDLVLLQINYLDWESPSIQSRLCYETAVRHGKQVVVMEPVKGGSLANLPEEADALLHSLRPEESSASWAIRFVTSLTEVCTVLSGMNSEAQMLDNMRDLDPLTPEETEILAQCAAIIRSKTAVACTGCSYCVPHCPKHIPIPRFFSLYNDYHRTPAEDWKIRPVYNELAAHAKASDCIECRRCEKNCPQKLPITTYLKELAKVFEA